MVYSFSFLTLFVIAAFFFVLSRLVSLLKSEHPEIYEGLGGKRIWYSAPDQLKFFGFLFGLRYRQLESSRLTRLAILSKLLLVVATVFIFTMPIYFQASV